MCLTNYFAKQTKTPELTRLFGIQPESPRQQALLEELMVLENGIELENFIFYFLINKPNQCI